METNHLSPFALEAFAQKTLLSPTENERAKSHLDSCATCRKELDDIQAARSRFDAEIGPRMRSDVVDRVGRRSWRAIFIWGPAVLVPTFAAALAFVLLQKPPQSDITVKGDTSLQVFAARGDRVFPVSDGDRLAAGDRLRFEVDHAGLPYLLVVSIDAADHASVYVPFGGNQSVRLGAERHFVSPGSVELDPGTGPERVFALFSHSPIQASTVEPALRALGQRGPDAIRNVKRLEVPADAQRSFLWENGAP